MTIVKTTDGMEFYLDETLKQNLDIAKANIVKDMDFIFAVDGGERSGISEMRISFHYLRKCFLPEDSEVL